MTARPAPPAVLLLDNGSREPASTLALRRTAAALADLAGRDVEPVSLLHSDRVAAGLIGGLPAATLEPTLRRLHAAGRRRLVIVPFFLGPSRALTRYLPERIHHLAGDLPGLAVHLAPPLAGPDGPGGAPDGEATLAALLADRVREVRPATGGPGPPVVLVDHGSPEPAVTAVRDRLALRLATILGADAPGVFPCSMERRDGPDYAFTDPLLAARLRTPPTDRGPVIVAHLFLSPGRHAGPGGDVAAIRAAAEAAQPTLRTLPTRLLGDHPGLLPLLLARLHAAERHPALPSPGG